MGSPSSPQTDASSAEALAEFFAENLNLESYIEFLQLDDADARRLRALLPLFEEQADAFVDNFYEHLLSFEPTAAFLRDREQVERLKQLQREHWTSTLEAVWDQEFLTRRIAVGRTHAVRGVEPLLFLGASYQFVQHLLRAAMEESDSASPEQTQQILAILKATFLDASLALESYFAKMTQDLRQALGLVWKANDKLRQFARLTSHDLKTPLATAANFCEEALDEFGSDIPDDAKGLIQSARRTLFRMSAAIDDLLAASMPTDDGDTLADVDTEAVIREALERLGPELDRKQIEVTLPDQLPTVIGNKVHLREAFFNVFSNAEKYADQTPARIWVELETRDAECVFAVCDNGPGIPDEELEQVFSAFRRLPMHRDRPGSGLGLYFAKSLIEHGGGRIWAESQPGQGSRFLIALPHGRSQ